jgi:Spy/CpxP family protein refolding chaperone
MKKGMIVLGLATVMLLGITCAYAFGPGFGPRHGGMFSCPQVSNLTPEQNTKFQELRRKLNEETTPLRGTILSKRLELQSLWTDPKADAKAITDKEKELRDLQNQMRDKMVQFRLEARNILTPEQLSEFGPGWGRGMREPGMGRGFGPGMGPGMGMRN